MMSLRRRLSLSYALFISIALVVLTVFINYLTGLMFARLSRDNVRERSAEIVRTLEDLYNPFTASFDTFTLESIGMYFTHEGYIITVSDAAGDPVWDARSCDMEECTAVIQSIADRMENQYHVMGTMQNISYPVNWQNRFVGEVSIETYGPFFYSATESAFLSSINKLLLFAGAAFTLISIIISILIARSVSLPILKAGEAAREIARVHAGGNQENKVLRIEADYKTRELRELSLSLNDLAAELEEGERRQRQLSADIAHELRTPLTCLQGNIEAMIDGVWEPTTERLVSCHEEVIRLNHLVEDLKLLTNIEWDEMTLEKTDFDLAKLLQGTTEEFRLAAGEKGIEIITDFCSAPVNADYDRLKQVFINLLSNAVKYTDSGCITLCITPAGAGTESVSIAASADTPAPLPVWAVSVADSGWGIDPQDLDHIFERFYRSDKSRDRSTGGSGIGLTIASAIVKAHGGSISAESESGKGSVFRVVLPGR
jgi:signal transduction histidine kinase